MSFVDESVEVAECGAAGCTEVRLCGTTTQHASSDVIGGEQVLVVLEGHVRQHLLPGQHEGGEVSGVGDESEEHKDPPEGSHDTSGERARRLAESWRNTESVTS